MNARISIHKLMPASEDPALSALAVLSTIRALALKEFLQAMAFVRPGFDE